MIGRTATAAFVIALMLVTNELHALVPPRPPSEIGEEFVPRPEVAKAFALGFDSLVSDYYWLRAVQIVGGSEGNGPEHAVTLSRLVDVVTLLDPWVDHPYRFAAVWLTDSPESVRKANELLRRGMEHHPDEWRNPFYLGFNLYFYLGENEQAAVALEQAAKLPGAPAYLGRLVARLRSHAHDLDTAATFLLQLIEDAQDDEARAGYQAALDEIEIEHKARQLDAAREAYRKRMGRDIEQVADLLSGDRPVLAALPGAEASSTPVHLRGEAQWVMGKKGRIVSSRYGRRYELTFHALDAKRRESWSQSSAGETSEEARR